MLGSLSHGIIKVPLRVSLLHSAHFFSMYFSRLLVVIYFELENGVVIVLSIFSGVLATFQINLVEVVGLPAGWDVGMSVDY